jgi:RecA-family ATPase
VAEHLPRVDWNALWADELEEEWICEPLLAARRLVALYSAPKVGKSLLMLEVAAAIANGKGMFGYPGHRPRRTLYVDFENDPRGDVRERLTNMGYGPADLDNLILLSFPTIAKFDTERGSQELMAAVEHYGAEIVVIDTVSRAIEGEENSNDTWLEFYKHTGLKMKQAGISMIRLDHSGKDEGKGQRGGSAKSGDVDAVWRLTKAGEDLFDLVLEAQRFPIAEKHLTLRRVEDPVLRHVTEGDGFKAKADELLASMTEKRVPKDLDMPLRQLKPYIRKTYGLTFKNVAMTEELWLRYRAQPVSWVPEMLPEEDGNV